MKILQGAGSRLTQMRFEFGESQLNGIEIGAVRRQVAQANPPSRKQQADIMDFVGGEIVEDERIAPAQLRTEHPLQINREHLGIDGTFDQKGRLDAFLAQGRNEGGTLPVAVREGAEATLAPGTATMVAGHGGVQTRFINKHQLADKIVVSWQEGALELGRRLNWEALREGLGRAQQMLFLGDGADWVWNLKQDRWKDAVELLDFYHGSEHLWDLGRALKGQREPALSHWVQPLRHQLRHGKEKQVLRQIANLQKRRGQTGKVIRREQGYFQNHSGRMNYQAIANRGWPIGSGAVESACRQKQCRFKRCGQFWTRNGLRNLCALDEARRNHHWDELWTSN